MDLEKASRLSHIGTFFLTIVLVILTSVLVVFAIWPPPWWKGIGMPLVWFLIAGLVLAGVLQLTAAFMSRGAHPPTPATPVATVASTASNVPAIRTPDSSWLRFIKADAEEAAPPRPGEKPADYPQKVRCEFLNSTDVSYKVRVLKWECGNRGLDAGLLRSCLQIRVANGWYPAPYGAEELHVPPGEYFRIWVFPKTTVPREQLEQRVSLGNLGTVHFWVDGQEVTVSVQKL
jgi:hypothetical protein